MSTLEEEDDTSFVDSAFLPLPSRSSSKISMERASSNVGKGWRRMMTLMLSYLTLSLLSMYVTKVLSETGASTLARRSEIDLSS